MSCSRKLTDAIVQSQAILGRYGGAAHEMKFKSNRTDCCGGSVSQGTGTKLIGYWVEVTTLKIPTSFTLNSAKACSADPICSDPLKASPEANYATTSALPAYTYANGTLGVGAKITINTAGALTIDGAAISTVNTVVLVKDEAGANAPYNGLYRLTTVGTTTVPAVLTRHTSMDVSVEFGAEIVVASGAANAGSHWFCATEAPTVGTTALTFSQGDGLVIAKRALLIPGGATVVSKTCKYYDETGCCCGMVCGSCTGAPSTYNLCVAGGIPQTGPCGSPEQATLLGNNTPPAFADCYYTGAGTGAGVWDLIHYTAPFNFWKLALFPCVSWATIADADWKCCGGDNLFTGGSNEFYSFANVIVRR